jgi:hypothetical protein
MPAYHGDYGALLHDDVLGGSSMSPLIVVAGGAARHPEYLGDLAGLSEHTSSPSRTCAELAAPVPPISPTWGRGGARPTISTGCGTAWA